MAILVGALLAFGVGILARGSGLDRDRAFYPTIMLVVAALYSLFAVLGDSPHALLVESLIGIVFLTLAVWGFRSSLWLVVFALGAHGAFDLVHGSFVSNPGVPTWWPPFCSAYDVMAAAFLAWLLHQGRVPPVAHAHHSPA